MNHSSIKYRNGKAGRLLCLDRKDTKFCVMSMRDEDHAVLHHIEDGHNNLNKDYASDWDITPKLLTAGATTNNKNKIEIETTKQPVSSITIISHGCLSFDLMFPSYVKTANEDEDWIDDPDELGAYRFEGTDELEADALTEWVKKHMTIQFDGGLDDPNAFESIKVVKMYGPDACEYSDEGLIVSGACFYLEVGTKQEINEDQLEDIFHIIIPTNLII